MSCSMFNALDNDLLVLLQARVRRLKDQVMVLEQAKRRERGAYVWPSLVSPTHQFEQVLMQSYDQLFVSVVESLRGRNDDLTSGRLYQAAAAVSDAEILAALDYWDVPEEEREHPLDRTKLAAILALLLLWRQRHRTRSEAFLSRFFDQGRTAALEEHGVETVIDPASQSLRGTILSRYRADLDRLEKALRDGSPRSHGLQWIVETAGSLGEALGHLRRLRDSERMRVEMFAESLAWTAWSEGYRAGAVEVTRLKAKELGLVTTEGLSLAGLTEEQRQLLPHYLWSGPEDERCCAPCLARFGEDVVAFDLADLPAPQDICRFGRSCRHWWSLST
jgi:hypothetical protein